MNVAEIIDGEVMTHLGLYGCVKNLDPYALLKCGKVNFRPTEDVIEAIAKGLRLI